MAKITKKIRIAEYDILSNEFKISFQLAGYDDHPKFYAFYDQSLGISLDIDSSFFLRGIGYVEADLDQAIEEIFDWIGKPRKSLDGLTYGHTMRSRFAVIKKAEKERHGRAEAERIIVEAPAMDWALSALDELERETTVKEDNESDKIVPAAVIQLARDSGIDIRNPKVLSKMQQAYSEARASVKAVAMKVSGLGEQSSNDPDAPVIDYVLGRMSVELGDIKPQQELGMRAAIRAGLVKYDRERAEVRKSIIDKAVQKAVSAIHTQASMSYRENQFLRDVVQEEIETVVGGVL